MTDPQTPASADSAPLDLAAITARTNAASPGPWAARDLGGMQWSITPARMTDEYDNLGGIDSGDDAQFIAQARSDVPELIAEVRRLREVLTEVAKHQEDMADSLDDHITHEDIHEHLLIGMRMARDGVHA